MQSAPQRKDLAQEQSRPLCVVTVYGKRPNERSVAVEEMLFERELIDAMHAAFTEVCARQRLRPGSSESDFVALRILDLAKTGVHDAETLASLALTGMNEPTD
jgi:hypothetical protein